MSYEELLIEADNTGLIVKEKNLPVSKGRILGNRIAIKRSIPTSVEKSCVLAEEIGHYHTNTYNILDQESTVNRKIEYAGRLWAYNKQVGLHGIIQGYHAHCETMYQFAEYLGVTEDFLLEAVDCYRSKYGVKVDVDNYSIIFEPSLAVIEKI